MAAILTRKHSLSNHLGGEVWCIVPNLSLSSVVMARARDPIVPRRVRIVSVPLAWHVAPAMGVLIRAFKRALMWVRAKRGWIRVRCLVNKLFREFENLATFHFDLALGLSFLMAVPTKLKIAVWDAMATLSRTRFAVFTFSAFLPKTFAAFVGGLSFTLEALRR